MSRVLTGLSAALILGLLSVPGIAQSERPLACPNDVLLPNDECPADVGAAAATCCPCDGFRNHGKYASCVAHATNTLRRAGCLDKEARRSLKRCAARSTCGKPEGYVTCCVQRPGVCLNGLCARTDPPQECTTDETCPPIPKCRLKRNAEMCLAKHGVPGTGSCCNSCRSGVQP